MRKLFALILFGYTLSQSLAHAQTQFTLSSPDIKNGDALTKKNEFSGFGCAQSMLGPLDICTATGNRFEGLDCNGRNIAPTFQWQNPPPKTQAFAFTVFDPDMPNGSGWWQFVIYNIAADARELKNGQLPKGSISVTNDSGTKYYMGPCPPRKNGKHRYIFTIYALDEKIDLPPTTTTGFATYVINKHRIGIASMVATYERN